MDKKKLLLVAISVGVFLILVISTSILIFSPKNSTDIAIAGNQGSVPVSPPVIFSAGVGANDLNNNPENINSTGALPFDDKQNTGSIAEGQTIDAANLVRNPEAINGLKTLPHTTATQETSFYINGAEPVDSFTIENNEGEATARVTVNFPRPTTAAVPNINYTNETSKPAAEQKPALKPAAPAPAAKAPAAKPAPAPKTYNDYWIQTGAFSVRSNAENAKNSLAVKGISSIIENREVNGKTLFQVRVGPYTSENEAKYWLALVQSVDGFSDSLVRQSTSFR